MRMAALALGALLVAAAGATALDIQEQAAGSVEVEITTTARVQSLVDLRTEGTIQLPPLQPDGNDMAVEGTSGTTLDASRSNVNVASLFLRTGLAPSQTLQQELNYRSPPTILGPGAGQWMDDDGNYVAWHPDRGNTTGLWLQFDDGVGASGAAADGPYTPYLIQLEGPRHQEATPFLASHFPQAHWSDGTSVAATDLYFQGAIVYHDDGLATQYVQTILRASGDEALCHSQGTLAAHDWSDLQDWDRLEPFSGELLPPEYEVADGSCTILGNRYALSYASPSAVGGEMVLSFLVQHPYGSGPATLQAALAAPADAPGAAYGWQADLAAVAWGPLDGIRGSPDDVRYP